MSKNMESLIIYYEHIIQFILDIGLEKAFALKVILTKWPKNESNYPSLKLGKKKKISKLVYHISVSPYHISHLTFCATLIKDKGTFRI